jgi:ABC-2 type transport system permease protein
MKGLQKIFNTKYGWLLLLVLLFAINFLASIFHSRIDLTKEKRYTLSNATKNLVKKIDDKVEVDVFLTGDFPSGFRKLANSTDEFLQLLKDQAGSKFSYRFVSPTDKMPGTEIQYGDSLIGMGALPINLTVQKEQGQSSNIIFPTAVIHYKGNQSLVNLYEAASRQTSQVELNNAEAMLEYQFAKALDGLINPERPLVGYSVGNGEPTPADPRTADLQQTLQQNYQLFTLNLNRQPFIPDTFKVLIVVKPTLQFSEDEKLKIDQYVMRGGKLLLFIDGLIAEQDSLRYKTETIAFDRNLNLTDLLFRYGLRINPDLVMDLQCDFTPFVVGGTSDNPQYEFLHWNYYPLFESKGNHIINKNIGLVAGRFVNSIDTINTPGVKKTVLLSSSANSRTISTPALISLNENRNVPEDEKFKKRDIPVALLLEGKFTSLYRNRISSVQQDSLSSYGTPFRDVSDENKMIVVADGDMVLNDFSPQQGPVPMGLNYFTIGSQYEYQFANRDFLLNCMEYLINNPVVIETRNKNIVLRLLDARKVQAQKATWQFVNIGVPVLLVLLAGLIYQQVRKKKYAA